MNSPQKILLIDDDALVAQLVTMLVGAFRDNVYVVEHAVDYNGGLQRLLSGSYALCLLDYRLASGDGLQLLREAKARNCPTPVILLTADGREETDVAAMAAGAADFINKSELKPEPFERAVHYAIKTAEAHHRLLAAQKGGAKDGKPAKPG